LSPVRDSGERQHTPADLDLLDRRQEAVAAYESGVGMNVSGGKRNDQFGLGCFPSEYPQERIGEPFTHASKITIIDTIARAIGS
jgi:hypothetical protein